MGDGPGWCARFGHLIAAALVSWIVLTAVALVGPHWADGLRLRSDRAVAHSLPAAGDGSSADDTTGGAPLFTTPGPDDETTTVETPGSGLLGPLASAEPEAAPPASPDAAPDASRAATHPSPDAQDRGGAAPASGPVAAHR